MLGFDQVIIGLKQGKKYARLGWNGKGMFIAMVEGCTVTKCDFQPAGHDFTNDDGDLVIQSHIDMFTANQTQCVGWLASQMDMLAEDWQEVT